MTRPSAGQPDGRPGQKSVDRSGRPMCTDVHSLGRLTARSTVRECLLSGNGPVDRAVDRWVIAQFPIDRSAQRSIIRPFAVDRAVDRQQTDLLTWPLTAIFWEPINWDSLRLFSTRFQVGFQDSFPTLLSVYLHLF